MTSEFERVAYAVPYWELQGIIDRWEGANMYRIAAIYKEAQRVRPPEERPAIFYDLIGPQQLGAGYRVDVQRTTAEELRRIGVPERLQ